MRAFFLRPLAIVVLVGAVFAAGYAVGSIERTPVASAVVSEDDALREDFDWGTLFSYYQGETYGTENVLAAVAAIKPGMEIHPPHRHTEEEVMIVTQGVGTWHLNGEEFVARAGDVLYAEPWDVHGITNTGTETLRFFVWKWDNQGVALPVDPEK